MFAFLSFPVLWVTITSFIFLGATVALRLGTNTTALWWATLTSWKTSMIIFSCCVHVTCTRCVTFWPPAVLQSVPSDVKTRSFATGKSWFSLARVLGHIDQICERMSKSNQVLKQAKGDHIFGILPQRKVTTTTFGRNGGTSWLLCLFNKLKENVFTIRKKNTCSRLKVLVPLFLLMEMDTHQIW